MAERENKGKDWRELCAAAAKEPDSDKLVCLVHQILRAFDEHDQASKLATPKQFCGRP